MATEPVVQEPSICYSYDEWNKVTVPVPQSPLSRRPIRLGAQVAARLILGLQETVAWQRVNWPCWLAIGLGIGVLLYFAAPAEPSLRLATGVVAIAGVMALAGAFLPRYRFVFWPILALFVISCGFTAACLRTAFLAPHFLATDIRAVPVVGRIAQIEPLPAGGRMTLTPAIIGRAAETAQPATMKLQITVLSGIDDLQPGDWVRLRADLHPPSGPAAPDAFDFRRQAFFSGVDGIGFSYTAKRIDPPTGWETGRAEGRFSAWADRLRQRIGQRIAQILPDETGALAIALVVGNQTALRKADMAAMRDSGLSHLLSISGLHISMAAGLVFFTCRFLFALWPWLALRIATKKWAAVLALMGATFYAVLAGAAEPSLSGSVVPTQRSLFMVAIAFIAILVDRSPISLRLVAWSAVILLLWQPESLIGPSFQMSFAAVFALIACFEVLRPHLTALRQYLSVPAVDLTGRLMGYGGMAFFWLFSLMLSSLVASLATAPFGLYHFDRLQIYGLVANMLAVPLTGFWLMPAAAIALLLMPLGLDAPFWQLLGWGCEVLFWIGRGVQHWPNAVIAIQAMPVWGLLAASAGLIWICLGHGWNRAWGLLGVGAMALSIATMAQPDILLSESGRLIALRVPANQLVVSSNRVEKRVRETWLRRSAQAKSDTFAMLAGRGDVVWLSCSFEDSCRVEVNGRKIVFDLGRVPGDISCRDVDVIIVSQRQINCDGAGGESGKPLVIDKSDLARTGALALYLKPQSIEQRSAAAAVGQRPWSAFQHAAADSDDEDATGADEASLAQ
ncbi:MAG TPA: ComEC/Rec2 family competence protein [Dongiaceae bacterium]|nr:ComEC/Rec2 family competence protein [Dongiaceae bacterium]